MLGQRADAGCIALSDVLRAQPSLRLSTLKLAKNYIGDAGALALAEALTHNLTLHTLDLSANEISLAAALELAAKLLANANPVQRLRLRGNGIDAAAAAELVHRNGLRGLAIEL
jgi:Ran GTPase-activating protein (RanGAP) involved in mRNA processing and transport